MYPEDTIKPMLATAAAAFAPFFSAGNPDDDGYDRCGNCRENKAVS
jgi:hypothetical protein